MYPVKPIFGRSFSLKRLPYLGPFLKVIPHSFDGKFARERLGLLAAEAFEASKDRPYLAVVLGLFSRMVPGWAMGERVKAKLVCYALRMALWRRRIPKGMVIQPDRGSQGYCLGYNLTRRRNANSDISPMAFGTTMAVSTDLRCSRG